MTDFFDLKCFLLNPTLSEEPSEKYVHTWLEYRAGGGVEDPDSSDGARYFYKELWGERLGITVRECRNTFSRRPSKYVQGDWMCSVATTFGKGLSLFVNGDEELKKRYLENVKPENRNGRLHDGVGGHRTYVPILLKDMEEEPAEQNFRMFWEDEVLQNFIRSAYTSANLIIVPDGFNVARYTHGENGTEDYWDLTLKKYYQDKESLFYKPRNDDGKYDVATPFRKLLKKNQEEGDPLCLNEWLDQENKPKMLPNKNPASMEEWRDLMREMTRRIDRRRDQMAQRMEQIAAKNR